MSTPTSKLLPIRPKPLPDEILSSWLVRVAAGYDQEGAEFVQRMWPDFRISDHWMDDDFADALVKTTGINRLQAYEMVTESYTGRLSMVDPFSGFWLLRRGERKRSRRGRAAWQYCPLCLVEKPAYFRKRWRVAVISVCTRHCCLLKDTCSGCNEPVHPVEDGSFSLDREPLRFSRCVLCSFDLGQAHPTLINSERALILTAICESQMRPPIGASKLHFFDRLRSVLEVLGEERFSSLRKFVRWESDMAPEDELEWPPRRRFWHEFADGAPAERAYELEMAAWCLEQWPTHFELVAKASGFERSPEIRGILSGKIQHAPPDTRTAMAHLLELERLYLGGEEDLRSAA